MALDVVVAKLPAFRLWLEQNGAEILSPTNPYEVLRFKAGDTTHIIYRNLKGRYTCDDKTKEIAGIFAQKLPWRATPALPRLKGKEVKSCYIKALVDRFGWACCYCDITLDPSTCTLEHFLALTHGGPNMIQNMGLSCAPCNQAVGHLSIVEKIRFAVMKRRKSDG